MAWPLVFRPKMSHKDTMAWPPQDETCGEEWLTRPGVALAGLCVWTTIAVLALLLCVFAPPLMMVLILSREVTACGTPTSKLRRLQPPSDKPPTVRSRPDPGQSQRAPKARRPGPDRELNQWRVRARPRSSTNRSGSYGRPISLTTRSIDTGASARRNSQCLPFGTVRWGPDLLLPGQRSGFAPCDSSLRELQLALEGGKGRHTWRRHGSRPAAIRVVLRDRIHPRERAMIWVRPDLGASAALTWRRGRGRRQATGSRPIRSRTENLLVHWAGSDVEAVCGRRWLGACAECGDCRDHCWDSQ
jgi:hypothetical protein